MSDFKQTVYVDSGTGAYPNPMEEPVTLVDESTNEPTGAVDGPPAEVTVVAEEHLGEPTGVASPPEPEPVYEWPGQAPKPKSSAKAVAADEVDDKAMRSSSSRTRKK